MKKLLALVLCVIMLMPLVLANADNAKEDWLDAQEAKLEAERAHEDAKAAFAREETDENEQEVVDTGKEVLHAALDEVEAWLWWMDAEADENDFLSEDLVETIKADVEANVAKLEPLRDEVDEISSRLELGLTWLGMLDDYASLIADVARNTGFIWAEITQAHLDTISSYEEKIRDAASVLDDESAVIAKLDLVVREIDLAQQQIEAANEDYADVRVPGNPIINFGQGNQHLRQARGNMVQAQRDLARSFELLMEEFNR